MSVEIVNCIKCGGEGHLFSFDSDYYVRCEDCDNDSSEYITTDDQEAIEEWNRLNTKAMSYELKFTVLGRICILTPVNLQIGCYKGTWEEWEENTIQAVLDDANSNHPSAIALVYKIIKNDLLRIKVSVEKSLMSVAKL